MTAALLAAGTTPASGNGAAEDKPVPAQATADQAVADAEERMEAQAPLSAAASRIQRVVDRGHNRGYAGIGLEADHVVVWWKGTVPGAVQRAVREVRRTVPVRVEAAAHTRAELESAAQEVTDYITANPQSGYHSVEVAYDGSGLVVNREPTASQRSTTASLPSSVDVPAGVPVQVQEQPRTELTGRLDDYAPFWAGGRINNNDNAAYCTAGWPVRRGATEYMLTAAHCGRPGGGWNNGNDTRFFGTGDLENSPHDVLLVRASVAPRMWDGGVGSGEFTKAVIGFDYTFPGEWLCASGSVSGAQCDYTVTNNFTYSLTDYDAYGNLETYTDLVLADYCCGTPSRGGDSGGPVFSLSASNINNVIAKGTITGYSGSRLVFQDFITAQRDFGITGIAS